MADNEVTGTLLFTTQYVLGLWGGYIITSTAGGSVDVSIPAIVSSASCGSRNSIQLPAISLAASCHADSGANLSRSLPAIELSARSHQEGYSAFQRAIPAITLSAVGAVQPASSLNRPIPAIALTAKCFGDFYGSLDKSIGAITLSASAYESRDTRSTVTLPSVTLVARVRPSAVIALALNTKNFGLSKYTSYDYNSLCSFNGKAIGAKRDGIYELAGADDNDTVITWKIRSGKIALGKNKLRHVWLWGKMSGDLRMTVETAEGKIYEYDVEPVSENEDSIKIKVGRGLDTRYVILEFSNDAEQTVTVDKIQGYGVKV